MKNVKLVGATGYAGGETIRLLLSHPEVRIQSATYDGKEDAPITAFYPQLRGISDLRVASIDQSADVEDGLDAVFMAVPDNVACKLAPAYLAKGVPVIDFSGDFRFSDSNTHKQWYGFDVDESLLKKAIYGLPELFRKQIPGAKLIANPGCYPTCALLALAPALKGGFVDTETVICDAKSGISGAGRNPKSFLHFPERNENLSAYKVASHRHIPEIEVHGSAFSGKNLRLTFVPHLIPINRGMLCTIYADLLSSQTQKQMNDAYLSFYENEPFVRVLPASDMPSVNTVAGTNFCDLQVHVDEHTNRLIVVSVIDNLVKGASGQAVQNLNLILGLEETTGLMTPGQYL
ncbi:MAG TPA: N-acetyl-gamma-glutamyl-phosphate reductase [bacterium]|nr:N-acetyl-gamma-glutamyl-phosphate reductase [bacterium]